jgi:hypothetical protein
LLLLLGFAEEAEDVDDDSRVGEEGIIMADELPCSDPL